MSRADKSIYHDPRPIASVWCGGWITVGYDEVTKIVAYPESGSASWVPAVEVWHGDHLERRIILGPESVVRYAEPAALEQEQEVEDA